jgi:hypothetical protein
MNDYYAFSSCRSYLTPLIPRDLPGPEALGDQALTKGVNGNSPEQKEEGYVTQKWDP